MAEATTDSSGNWSLTVAEPSEGDWSVYWQSNASTVVWDPDGDYGTQPASPTVSVGDDVSSGYTTKLEEGGRLSGTITGDGATSPEGEYVLERDWGFAMGIIVGADGSYTTPGLPNGSYYITYPSDHSEPYVSEATYHLGSISDGEDTASDHKLSEYATVSGRVTDGAGNGLNGIKVSGSNAYAYAYTSPTGGSTQGFLVHSLVGGSSSRFETLTDSDGNYSYDSAIPGAAFKVEFSSSDGEYATEYYDDKTNSGEADIVEIPRRGDVSNIDAQLGLDSTITVSGSVIPPEIPPFVSVNINLCSNDHCQRASRDSAGLFKYSGLNAATYTLSISVNVWNPLTGERFNWAAETTVEFSEGTVRHFVVVLDEDDEEYKINEAQKMRLTRSKT